MKFAGLEEMEKLREEMRQVMLFGYDPHYKCSPIEDRTDLLVALLNLQGVLILKLCHAIMRDDERITELEAWRKQNTGDGK
jgi:hypothetical protein